MRLMIFPWRFRLYVGGIAVLLCAQAAFADVLLIFRGGANSPPVNGARTSEIWNGPTPGADTLKPTDRAVAWSRDAKSNHPQDYIYFNGGTKYSPEAKR